jgi:hypothetical protein
MRGRHRDDRLRKQRRRARVYTITRVGRKRLNQETETWQEFALSMQRVLGEGG